ncbi:hypothetical protein BEL04_09985 [Mucilaginibacter sp. PPCGB 2223]|uniref:hypothetical protein n=1 Tax=Mucilaginibacter sp. PPCGB 2223 TaxID=1886027 RepID=UPI000826ECEB|nr:hypothetical protein [Mucilaginibacter sp. PPCGB 2223]OCX54556.1 hypothetical protein BEL04_09985 [Mucilaginibacter sp. PPCGB 2223]
MRKKIKYQGGITKALCQRKAERNKREFAKGINAIDISAMTNPETVNFEIISFSGASGFEDQVLSIFSFLVYAGTPVKWTIYSDKSYSQEQKQAFKNKFPFAAVVDWDEGKYIRENQLLADYLKECHLAKKLNAILSHPYDRQTIYIDSDILFYKNFAGYLESGLLDKGLWYAPDTMWGNNAANYFKHKTTSIYPLNSGLLIMDQSFNKADIFEYLESLKGKYHYFSEQSSFEYAFRKQDANVLDPRQFIIDTADQFDFATKYHPDEIAMRHYTGPVRHKMWQNGWEWHLKAK